MARANRSLLALLLLWPICLFAFARDRLWQSGTLLDTQTKMGSRIIGDSDELMSLRNDVTYYRVDAGQMVYVVARSLRSRRDKALDLIVNRPVQYAVDGSNFYLRDEEGKEHKLSIEEKIAK